MGFPFSISWDLQQVKIVAAANGQLLTVIAFFLYFGIIFFILGNCLNFISFGYAAQSLLAALGSVQFVSNIAFAYFVLNKMVTVKVLVATAFIVLGNIFLVAFGNHQSPGAVGSCSVLFAKSLSNLLRLAMSNGYELHSWFTYSMILLFLSTAGFWMARLNAGLSLFDAILIVPMFQIAWTFFSICTGFIYFQEYQVFDALRTTMFILGMMSVFIGISLLAPDESRGGEVKDNSHLDSVLSSSNKTETDRLIFSSEDAQNKEIKSFTQGMMVKVTDILAKAKTTCSLSLGFGEDSINASAILVMPMVSSKITGFRGRGFDRSRIFFMRNSSWSRVAMDEDSAKMLNEGPVLPQSLL